MKKKKIVVLAVVVLIIVGAIVATVMILNNNNDNNGETRLTNIYNTLTSSETYTFTMMQDDSNKTIMTKNGEETAIDLYTNDSHSTTIIRDGNTYLVLHDRSEYYVYEGNDTEQNILTNSISELFDTEYTTGTEKLNGKKYYYEEYKGSTFFMVSTQLKLNEEVTTRFYFDKNNNLKYIKTTYGETEELLQIEVTNTAEESLFTIPSDYAEN